MKRTKEMRNPGPAVKGWPWAGMAFLFLLGVNLLLGPLLCHGEVLRLEEGGVKVLFEAPHGPVARELARIYPEVRKELEALFQWDLDLMPTVLLFRDSREFQRRVGSPMTVAFAVPRRDIIAMDYPRISRRPFSLRNIFKHELCHLLLHRRITRTVIPRWLDEGVAQWASEGVLDIVWDQKRSPLNRAALTGRFIPLRSLSRGFPGDGQGLVLAYEESRSFVEYIVGRFGPEGLLRILNLMRGGEDIYSAVRNTCSVSLRDLEKEWQGTLKRKTGWFTFISYYLYEILFTIAGLMTIFVGIRFMIRKRRMMEEEMMGEDL